MRHPRVAVAHLKGAIRPCHVAIAITGWEINLTKHVSADPRSFVLRVGVESARETWFAGRVPHNWLYNFLWFNNGYHQEHHWDPKNHWTRMRELHERFRPQLEANGTRVLRGPNITGLIEDYLTGGSKRTPDGNSERRAA